MNSKEPKSLAIGWDGQPRNAPKEPESAAGEEKGSTGLPPMGTRPPGDPDSMNVDEYRRWRESQPSGKNEFVSHSYSNWRKNL